VNRVADIFVKVAASIGAFFPLGIVWVIWRLTDSFVLAYASTSAGCGLLCHLRMQALGDTWNKALVLTLLTTPVLPVMLPIAACVAVWTDADDLPM